MIYPAYFREARYAHSYGGVHFALLDIVQPKSQDGGETDNDNTLHLLFRVIDRTGRTVMYKTFPLPSPATSFPSFTKHMIHKVIPTERQSWEEKALESIHCVPFWGEIDLWRILLFRAIVVIAIMCCILLPLCLMGWFLFASVYYIFIGAELSRRHKIEEQYQLNKEKIH